jgi:hypothetical protein
MPQPFTSRSEIRLAKSPQSCRSCRTYAQIVLTNRRCICGGWLLRLTCNGREQGGDWSRKSWCGHARQGRSWSGRTRANPRSASTSDAAGA